MDPGIAMSARDVCYLTKKLEKNSQPHILEFCLSVDVNSRKG